jgi:hypothetical protein
MVKKKVEQKREKNKGCSAQQNSKCQIRTLQGSWVRRQGVTVWNYSKTCGLLFKPKQTIPDLRRK